MQPVGRTVAYDDVLRNPAYQACQRSFEQVWDLDKIDISDQMRVGFLLNRLLSSRNRGMRERALVGTV